MCIHGRGLTGFHALTCKINSPPLIPFFLAADEIPKEDTVALLNELCDKEDDEGFFPYGPFIDRLTKAE